MPMRKVPPGSEMAGVWLAAAVAMGWGGGDASCWAVGAQQEGFCLLLLMDSLSGY